MAAAAANESSAASDAWDEELGGEMDKMPFHESQLKEWGLAHHLRHSPMTLVCNVVILGLVTGLLVWVWVTPDHIPHHWLYWLIEAIVSAAVVFDLATEVQSWWLRPALPRSALLRPAPPCSALLCLALPRSSALYHPLLKRWLRPALPRSALLRPAPLPYTTPS